MKTYKKALFLSVTVIGIVMGTVLTNSCVHQPYVLPEALRTGDSTICFESDILPIFQSNCAKGDCHGAGRGAGGYTLDNYADITRKGIVPGNPAASKIYDAIAIYKGERMMPRNAPALSAADIDLIKRWILGGAIDSGACYSITCDTNSYTYSGTIAPLMQKYCVGCHYTSSSDFTDYNTVKDRALNGYMIPDISHEPGYLDMPQGSPKLLDCQITQVKKWAAAGAPNN